MRLSILLVTRPAHVARVVALAGLGALVAAVLAVGGHSLGHVASAVALVATGMALGALAPRYGLVASRGLWVARALGWSKSWPHAVLHDLSGEGLCSCGRLGRERSCCCLRSSRRDELCVGAALVKFGRSCLAQQVRYVFVLGENQSKQIRG